MPCFHRTVPGGLKLVRVSRSRCGWVGDDPLMQTYHDREWGVPVRDERLLFEMLTLEGAQAGLSWRTILHKRQAYRRGFADFDPARVARFTPARVERLLQDRGIVRNRLKIESTIDSARALVALRRDRIAFPELVWGLAGDAPRQNRWRVYSDAPARTDQSRRMSRELKKLGFRFVGPTICYAFMQAVGMVNDHEMSCFRREPVRSLGLRRKIAGGEAR